MWSFLLDPHIILYCYLLIPLISVLNDSSLRRISLLYLKYSSEVGIFISGMIVSSEIQCL